MLSVRSKRVLTKKYKLDTARRNLFERIKVSKAKSNKSTVVVIIQIK